MAEDDFSLEEMDVSSTGFSSAAELLESAESSLPSLEKYARGIRYDDDRAFVSVSYDNCSKAPIEEFEQRGLFVDGHLWSHAAARFVKRHAKEGFTAGIECYHTQDDGWYAVIRRVDLETPDVNALTGDIYAGFASTFLQMSEDGVPFTEFCYGTWPFDGNLLHVTASETKGTTPDELRRAHMTPKQW